jgi:hypothetical protein
MIAHAGELALERGKETVRFPMVEGPRNQPARELIASLPNPLTAETCSAVRWQPRRENAPLSRSAAKSSGRTAAGALDYGRIARDLSRPSLILEAIRADKPSHAGVRGDGQAPRTDLERALAAIWADVLHAPQPGINEDFFDLGGHSLLAVQLLSRVRQELSVELTMDLVYAGRLTIAGIAAAVELAQADPEEIDRLTAEIENLSEEELRALLAEE